MRLYLFICTKNYTLAIRNKEFEVRVDFTNLEYKIFSTVRIPTLSKDQLQSLHLLRQELKAKSLSGRILKIRDREKYNKESLILSKLIFDKIDINNDTTRCPDVSGDKDRILTVKKRYNAYYLFVLFIRSFLCRAFKKFFQFKKIPISGGKIIIISGPDGSGKSTLCKTLLANIGQIYTCAQLNVGLTIWNTFKFLL